MSKIMNKRRIRSARAKTRIFENKLSVLSICCVVAVLAVTLSVASISLHAKNQSYKSQEAELEKQLEAQEERADEIDELEEYVGTDKYVEDVAKDKDIIERVMSECTFGGGCVNDTIIHLATSEMGFGGVGESGMGAYHGKVGFDTFTHYKSIVDKKTWIDLPMRYQPYKKLNEKLLKMFLK